MVFLYLLLYQIIEKYPIYRCQKFIRSVNIKMVPILIVLFASLHQPSEARSFLLNFDQSFEYIEDFSKTFKVFIDNVKDLGGNVEDFRESVEDFRRNVEFIREYVENLGENDEELKERFKDFRGKVENFSLKVEEFGGNVAGAKVKRTR